MNTAWITYPWRNADAYERCYAALQAEIAERRVSVSSRWGGSVPASSLASTLATLTNDAFVEELVLRHRWNDVVPCTTRDNAETRAAFEAIWMSGEFGAAYAFAWDMPPYGEASVWPR